MSNTRRQLLGGALLLAVAGATPASAQTPLSLRGEIEALNQAMVDAFKKNPASVARFYTDDATIAGGGMRAVGRDQIDRYWSSPGGPTGWKLELLEVGGDSLTPWQRGRSIVSGEGGRTMTTEFIGLLKRQPNGELRFSYDMYVAAGPARTQ